MILVFNKLNTADTDENPFVVSGNLEQIPLFHHPFE